MKNSIKTLLCAGLVLLSCPLFSQNYNMQLRSTMSFPGQTLANICGYTQNGREYALLGGSKGLIIVDITNPDVPQQIVARIISGKKLRCMGIMLMLPPKEARGCRLSI